MATGKTCRSGTGANLGSRAKLWPVADKRRDNLDAAGYKHFALRYDAL